MDPKLDRLAEESAISPPGGGSDDGESTARLAPRDRGDDQSAVLPAVLDEDLVVEPAPHEPPGDIETRDIGFPF